MLTKKFIPVMLMALAMGLGACGNPGTSQPGSSSETPVTPSSSITEKTHTVTFYDGGAVYGDPVTVKEGETVAKPTDPTKAGDEFINYTFTGWYTAGAETAFDFATPITSDLDLYSEYTEVARTDYDLVVFVYGINGATEPTTYITEEESDFMKTTFESTLTEDANILWHYVAGKKNANFNEYVVNSKLPVDLVISGNKLDNDDVSIGTHDTYGKVHLGDGWIANTSRYLTITDYVAEGHLELALKAYELLRGIGPKYEITLDKEAISLEIGDTAQLTATYYGAAPTITLSAEGIVSVSETLLVTALAAGEVTITAKDAAGNEAKCVVTVTAAPIVPTYDLVIALNNSNASNNWMSVEDAEFLVEAFTKSGQPGAGKNVKLHVISGVNIAGVVEAINEINKDQLARVDAALCRSAFFENKATTGSYDLETLVDVHASWGYSSGQYAIATDAFAEHIELATAFAEFVKGTHIDYFEIEKSAKVKIGETVQLTTVTGATYTSSNEAIATVSATGLVTGVAAGSAKVKVVKGAYEAEVSITVEAAEVQAAKVTIYIHTTASKTTYVDEAALEAIKTTAKAAVSEVIELEFVLIEKTNNAGTTDALVGADHVSLAVSAKAAIEDTGLAIEETCPIKKVNASFAASGESRYCAVFAGLPAAELAAASLIYNALIA